MALNVEEVRKIAALARLRFTPEEEDLFVGQLGKIVDYIDQLQRYEVGTEADSSVEAREAEDRAHECLPREQFLANAPAALDGFLLVPAVKGSGDDG
ncbi:MAG TPA: Asp-tRNA(Asn)/Glu-tRNA(Gln) amidotransferase subunit GatC [Thermoanaerobaculia bacterium]|nr:Asp-tRNA(Asn)/Glu-tRNA(Gln) amidotransferase subunit GatC [Thermoanaerobaculia bacterium]